MQLQTHSPSQAVRLPLQRHHLASGLLLQLPRQQRMGKPLTWLQHKGMP